MPKRLLCWLIAASCMMMIYPAFAVPSDYTKRSEVIQFIEEISKKHDLDNIWLMNLLSQAEYQSTVIKAILPGTKATRSWKRYRSIMVNETRITQGLAFWRENRATLQRAEQTFGVPAKYIVAIIGIETAYGRTMGNYRLIDALTTLAFDYPRRAAFFKGELEQFLLLCKEQGWDPLTIKGSYAGAIGLPQFMPSSYRQYAVDFNQDGKIRLFDSPEDAIGSVANYLKEKGWQTNEPVADPVSFKTTLPNTEKWQNPTIAPELTASQLEVFLPSYPNGEPTQSFALIPLETPKEPTLYWLGYPNFYVITRYNQSSFYAMSVFQLGEALEKRMQK